MSFSSPVALSDPLGAKLAGVVSLPALVSGDRWTSGWTFVRSVHSPINPWAADLRIGAPAIRCAHSRHLRRASSLQRPQNNASLTVGNIRFVTSVKRKRINLKLTTRKFQPGQEPAWLKRRLTPPRPACRRAFARGKTKTPPTIVDGLLTWFL